MTFETCVEDNNRINAVFNFVKDNFREPIAIETAAGLAPLAAPFTKFVNDYRLAHAPSCSPNRR